MRGDTEDNYTVSSSPPTHSSRSVPSLAIIKPAGPIHSLSDLQVMNLSGSMDSLHSLVRLALGPYFDSVSSEQSRDKGLQLVRKKLSELEVSFLHLQHDITIPDITLETHQSIQDALAAGKSAEDVNLDASTLNELQTCVNSWIKAIQTITKLDRDPAEGGSASEINFWLTMEEKLGHVSEQLEGEGVTLTLEVLKNAKRFHATVSFLSDTGLKEAMDTVSRYNVLLRDFPLDELLSADDLDAVTSGLVAIFNHVTKKLRVSSYPVWRCLALVECISEDFNHKVKAILAKVNLMQLSTADFGDVISRVQAVFSVWNDLVKEFTNAAREVSRRRSEKFIPIRIKARHIETKDRITYVANFRQQHESLVDTLSKVKHAGVDIDEITTGYDLLKSVSDVLDTSSEAIGHWNTLEENYNNATLSVERSIISILRDRLALAKNSTEMFRVFGKFNSLFVRPSIRGAIHEYQARLIENVKSDLSDLQLRFKRKYGNSETHEMAKLRDLPPVSGAIIWMKQLERQLDLHLSRVESVLGAGWEHYADGRALHEESLVFRRSLDATAVFQAWVGGLKSRDFANHGSIFKVMRDSNDYSLSVSFNPTTITLFKEVRHLLNMKFQVPHTIISSAKDAKLLYPFAVSLMDSVQVCSRTLAHMKSRDLPRELLYGFENAIYTLVSRGVAVSWDDLLHDSKQRLVYKLSDAVNTLSVKVERLSEVWIHVQTLLVELEGCEFESESFSKILTSIQASYDSLEHDGYANMVSFATTLNLKLKAIFERRLKSEFADFFKTDVNFGHVLVLKNNLICVEPPLQKSRVDFVIHVTRVIGTVTRLGQIDSREDVLQSRDLKFSNVHVSTRELYAAFDASYAAASGYVSKWHHFQSLWALSTDHVFDVLGDDFHKWLLVLQEVRRSRATFESNSTHVTFGSIALSIDHVQSRIAAKYDVWQSAIVARFAEKVAIKVREVAGEMDRIRGDLEPAGVDSSVEKTLQFVTLVVSTENKLVEWISDVEVLRQSQVALTRHRFVFPSDWLYVDHVEALLSTLEELVAAKQTIIDTQRDALKSKIELESARLSEKIADHVFTWADSKPSGGRPEEAHKTLAKYKTQTDILQNEWTVLEGASRALEVEFNVENSLSAVSLEIADFTTVWTTLDSVWGALDELREVSWHSIVVRKVRSALDGLVASSKAMPSRVRQYSAFEHVQSTLKTLLKTLPLIQQLKGDAMKSRHWEQLSKVLKTQLKLNSLTLGQVWDCSLLAHESQVKGLLAQAQGELTLEEFLGGVKSTWASFALALVNYKNKCRLIKNWDELFTTCGDHLSGLQGMHNSPYFKVFEEECSSWENKLNRVMTLFDAWIHVQRQWVYLEGVFGQSSDIRNILPLETSRFGNINAEFMLLWKQVYKSPLVVDVLLISGVQQTVDRLNDSLGKVQKSLGEFLEKQRQLFPRFYFVGDEDLLEMIGSPSRVTSHLKKMFSGVSGLVEDDDVIYSIVSSEGEVVELEKPVKKVEKIEHLLKSLEAGVKDTLKALAKEAVADFLPDMSAKSLMVWIKKFPAQITVLAIQIWWTGVKGDREACVKLLADLAEHVSHELPVIDRLKCENLITELIHLRDLACGTDYEWMSQMRYYLVDDDKELEVKQGLSSFSYGWEYLGVPPRLVATPLIDRCFSAMTSALAARQGGSPFGPAGTGKTESIKALGHNLGQYVLVFNCDESFDFPAVSRILSGICQSGVWACFDEFNRLDEGSLSAVASLVERIAVSLGKGASELTLGSRTVSLLNSTGLFMTMNPGYAGRSSLPDNLKRLFRSFSMARPDKELIAEVVLYSQGFSEASELSKKAVPFFTDCERLMSSQKHYDFGLRALKSVLSVAGRLKLADQSSGNSSETSETATLVYALRQTISPMLVEEDELVLQQVEKQQFGDIGESQSNQQLEEAITSAAMALGYSPTSFWVHKALQLSQLINTHHGVMLVGRSGAGKSSIIRTLVAALKDVETHHIDPKVMSKDELYGSLDSTTREWTDGLFTSILRGIIANVRGSKSSHWIIFDGDVDPEWVENLNSVLDDNKIFTLASGERLELPENVRLLFEVETLQYATPATVSRCGMVYIGANTVATESLVEYHLQELCNATFEDDDVSGGQVTLEMSKLAQEVLKSLPDILLASSKLSHIMNFTPERAIATLFGYLEDACRQLLVCDVEMSPEQRKLYLTRKLVLGLIWAFAGDSSLDERLIFDQALYTIPCLSSVAIEKTLDYTVSLPEGQWTKWEVPTTVLPVHAITNPSVIVPTTDTVRHEELIYGLLSSHKPILLCGPPGSGKTMTLFGALRKSDRLDMVALNFSKATSPELIVKTLMQHCEFKKTVSGVTLVPSRMGKWLVVFCDEINLPEEDKYGTQRVISFIRQLVERGGFWHNNQWCQLSRIQFVGACNPPTDVGRATLTERMLRHTALIMVDYPGEESLKQIYGAFNGAVLKTVPSLRSYADTLTNAMVEFYQQFSHVFTEHNHYVYSPRELTRWARGIYECLHELETLPVEGLVRVVGHEAIRLFLDRLVTQVERDEALTLLQKVLGDNFNLDTDKVLSPPILYSNWTTKQYGPITAEAFGSYVESRMSTFCEEELDTPFVLSDDVIDHILRIDRVLRQPQGHLILIGVAGSGRTTMSRFVAWINGFKTFQLKITRGYDIADFDADLRTVLKRAGCSQEKTCFILNEADLVEPVFLERMNTLLANAEIPGLFEGDEWVSLMSSCKEGAQRSGVALDTPDELYSWFTSQIVANLHVILVMSPSTNSDLATASPALFNRCVLNWMGNWTKEGVYQVASKLTSKLDLEKSSYSGEQAHREVVLRTFGEAHGWSDSADAAMSTASPSLALSAIHSFLRLYNLKKASLADEQRHLNNGLDRLKETVLTVRELKASLGEKEVVLKAKDAEAQETLNQMITNQNDAEKKREASLQIQQSLATQKVEIEQRQSIVLADLELAEPAVHDARQSVSNIKKQHLTELRSMLNPPETIKLTMESVCTMLGYRTSTWRDVQAVIRRDDFISSIVNFDSEGMDPRLRLTMEREYLSLPNYNHAAANRASKACGPLLQWVEAQVSYCAILERIGPLREEVGLLRHQAQQTEAQAVAIEQMITELEGKIVSYRDQYASLISQSQRLKGEMESVKSKVERSQALLTSLGSERTRWTASIASFDSKLGCLAGNSLVAALFLAYCGKMEQKQREQLLEQLWTYLASFGIEHQLSSQQAIIGYLTTPETILSWQDSGLPVDDLCAENALMIESAVQYPLIIDPTDRIKQFLVARHKLVVTSFLDSAFVKHLETALRFGHSILIQDAEYLDPIINPVLNKEYHKTGGRTLIQLGKQLIDFSPNFKLFLVTRATDFDFSPHVTSRTTLVNFTITPSSLERQLSAAVLKSERPDVDSKRRDLMRLQGEYQLNLRQLESDLLHALSTAVNILEDDDVMKKLESIKVEAAEIGEKMKTAEDAMDSVVAITQQFGGLSLAATRLFGVLQNMATVNHVYQFSLEFFFDIFFQILEDCKGQTVEELTSALFRLAYKKVSAAVFHTDRDTLGLLMLEAYSGEPESAAATEDLSQIVESLCVGAWTSVATDSLADISSQTVALCCDDFDPSYRVVQLASDSGATLKTVSMGSIESQGIADSLIESAASHGDWVLVQNAHLQKSWLTHLEKRLRLMAQPHKGFRLFLTLDASTAPATLLLLAHTVTAEAPPGVQASMQSTFPAVAQTPVEQTRLFFLASWLHAVITELTRFVPLGWQKDYEFHEGDFDAALRAIGGWTGHEAGQRSNVSPSALPWTAITSVVSEVYGGKIEVAEDYERLQALVSDVLRVDYFNTGVLLGPRAVPDGSDVASFVEWIKELPQQEASWLGLNTDADDIIRARHAEGVVKLVEELR